MTRIHEDLTNDEMKMEAHKDILAHRGSLSVQSRSLELFTKFNV